MCLSIPGKVIEIKENEITVDYGTEQRTSEFSLVDIKVGDYVVVSNKVIVARVEKKDAEKFLEIAK